MLITLLTLTMAATPPIIRADTPPMLASKEERPPAIIVITNETAPRPMPSKACPDSCVCKSCQCKDCDGNCDPFGLPDVKPAEVDYQAKWRTFCDGLKDRHGEDIVVGPGGDYPAGFEGLTEGRYLAFKIDGRVYTQRQQAQTASPPVMQSAPVQNQPIRNFISQIAAPIVCRT